jgi:hypothetical protein
MGTPTLTPVRPPRAPSEARSASPPPPPAFPRRASGVPRRVWILSLLVSVGLHLAVLLLSPIFLRVGPPTGGPAEGETTSPERGLQVMRVVPSASADPEDPALDPPSETPAVSPPRMESPTVPTPARTPTEARGGAGTPARPAQPGAADAPLRPGIQDPRLWVTPRDLPPPPDPTDEELHARYMAGLEARIRAYNDSVAGVTDRSRRATNWTVKDGDGNRWGVSPDGIHLGGVTLPPVVFPPGGGDPDKRAQAEEAERTRGEIDRQQSRTDARRAQQEGARATRERRDAERRAAGNN